MHRSTRPADLEETTRTIADALMERFHSGKTAMLASQMPTESVDELPKANPKFVLFHQVLANIPFVNKSRQRGLYFSRPLQPVILVAITSGSFAPLEHGAHGVNSRFGSLQLIYP